MTQAGFTISRLVVARAVEHYEPVDAADTVTIQPGEKVFTFLEVTDVAEPSTVRVKVLTDSGRALGAGIELSLREGRRYRTWAFTRGIRSSGHYTTIIEDADGNELARRDFEAVVAPLALNGRDTADAPR